MKGQISISWVLGIGATIVLAAFGTMTASNVRTDTKIGNVQQNISQVSERAAKLETLVPTIDGRLTRMENSLEDIKDYFKIPTK